MDIKKLYKNHLQKIKLMQLATCADNQPWLCNVWFVADGQDNIYWISRETRRHSQEITKNSHIACTFHESFNEGLGEKGQALVISGTAEKLTAKDIETAYNLYANRYLKLLEMQSLENSINDTGVHKFYKCTPQEIIWWDEVNFPDQPKQVVK